MRFLENLTSGCRLRIVSKKDFLDEQKKASKLNNTKHVIGTNEEDRKKIVEEASAEVIGFLKVDILEAKNLPSMDLTRKLLG